MLIRHTRILNPVGVCYGRTDLPLAPTFAAEATVVRGELGGIVSIVYTSPARRCRQLAQTLGAAEVCIDDRLLELDFGDWENRAWNDLPRAEVDAWAANFVDNAPPGGETFRALAARVHAFRNESSRDGAIIVTHAGVIRAWLCAVHGRPLEAAFAYHVGFGEVVSCH